MGQYRVHRNNKCLCSNYFFPCLLKHSQLDQSITKSAFDSVGFMPVLPGPCGLYRYKEFGTLEEGVMHQYFSLVNKKVDSIIFGNVQLAEDRIPSCLLVFRDDSGSETADKNHKPRTGFVHDAIFYFEAEKPLGQLVKQRRRWINGTFAAYLWVVREGWIWRGNHSLFVKLFATLFVFINLIQGVFIRLFGPSLLAVGLYTACLVIPALLSNTPVQTLDMLYNFEASQDVTQGVRSMAVLVTLAYLIIYALFMIGHTPRAVPIKEGALKGRWRSDKSSAYRPWLFALGFLANAISVTLLLLMGGIIFAHVGWVATPLAFRLVVLFSVVPYGIALMDGLINSRCPNVTSLFTLLWATPCYLLASIWFSVWLPAYTTARISDLSWGNRDNGGDDQSSEVAKHRANVGKMMTTTLILSNVLATGAALALQSVVTGALQVVLLTCIGVMSIHFGVAGVDISIRFLRKLSFVIMCGWCVPTFKNSMHDHEEEEEEKTKPRTSDSTMATTVSGGSVDLDFFDMEDGEHVHFEDGSSTNGNEDLEKSFTIMNLADLDVEEKGPVHSCRVADSSNLTGKTFIEETSATSLATGTSSSWDSLKWSDVINIEKEREYVRTAYNRGDIDNTSSSHTASSTNATSGWSDLKWSQLIATAEKALLSQISLADHGSANTANEDIETAHKTTIGVGRAEEDELTIQHDQRNVSTLPGDSLKDLGHPGR
jgi:hypothetical protein